MSNLSDAVFGAQLSGNVIAGQELTSSVVHDAAMQAGLTDSLLAGEGMTGVEDEIFRAHMTQDFLEDGELSQAEIIDAHLQAGLDASLVDGLIS